MIDRILYLQIIILILIWDQFSKITEVIQLSSKHILTKTSQQINLTHLIRVDLLINLTLHLKG
jgi:hypothetical protein